MWRLILSVFFALKCLTVCGQFGERESIVELGLRQYAAIAHGDFDMDGDVDLILRTSIEQQSILTGGATILWNDGDGQFEDWQFFDNSYQHRAVTVGDMDGDGDLDLLPEFSNFNFLCWYQNDGTGQFTLQVIGEAYDDFQLGDPDNDGRMEIIVSEGTEVGYLECNGDMSDCAYNLIGQRPNNNRFIAAEDFDGDGNIDLLFDHLGIFIGLGDGQFSAWSEIGIEAQATSYRYHGDVDGDGATDLAVWREEGDGDGEIVILQNDGSNGFSLESPVALASDKENLILIDLNEDALPELVSTYDYFSYDSLQVRYRKNLGGTSFGDSEVLLGDKRRRLLSSLPDFNGDGKEELIASYPDFNSIGLLKSDADYSFEKGSIVAEELVEPTDMEVYDFDGDGLLDLLYCSPEASVLFFRKGAGDLSFGPAEAFSGYLREVQEIELMNAGSEEMQLLLSYRLNNSYKKLLASMAWDDQGPILVDSDTLMINDYRTSEIRFADVNSDGMQDLICLQEQHSLSYDPRLGANEYGEQIIIVEGGFKPIGSIISAEKFAFLEEDTEGAKDVLFLAKNRLWTAEGLQDGSYAYPSQVDSIPSLFGMSYMDLNADGLQDLILGDANSGTTRVYLAGADDSYILEGAQYSYDFFYEDWDGDGDIDLLLPANSTAEGLAVIVYANDGQGMLEPMQVLEDYSYPKIKFADADMDGDLDLFVLSSQENRISLHENLTNDPSSVQAPEASEVRVYPNPATGVFYCELPKPGLLQVYDLLGRIVIESEASGLTEVDLRAFPDGLYFLKTDDAWVGLVKAE